MLAYSVSVKKHIVKKDPHEKDIRKALNLGHTFGHAFEAFSLDTPNKESALLHGYAVAFGLICELYLSSVLTGLDGQDAADCAVHP